MSSTMRSAVDATPAALVLQVSILMKASSQNDIGISTSVQSNEETVRIASPAWPWMTSQLPSQSPASSDVPAGERLSDDSSSPVR